MPLAAPAVAVVEVPDLEARALLLLLADRRLFEPFTVERCLQGDASLRTDLAVALGRIGDSRGGPVLQDLLFDVTPAARRAAAFALGQLGDPSAAPQLLRAAVDRDRETGRLAVEALAKLEVPLVDVLSALASLEEAEGLQRLLPFLFRFEGEEVVSTALAALASASREPRGTTGSLREAAEVDLWATYALTYRPEVGSAPALRALLSHSDSRVRAWAARGLGEVGEAADLEALRLLLEDSEVAPRVQALSAAGRLVAGGKVAAPEGWRREILRSLHDASAAVRITALEVAGSWLRDEELSSALVQSARTGSLGERRRALAALSAGGDPAAYDLMAAAASEEVALRCAAAEAAALSGAVALLRHLAEDTHSSVRLAAFLARLDVGDEDREALTRDALGDRDPAVRASALEWLTGHPVVEAETLQSAFLAAQRDRIPDPRLAAVRAMAARAQQEPLERGTLLLSLDELARHSSYLVRRQAVTALRALGEDAPPIGAWGPGMSQEAYRQAVQRTSRPRSLEMTTSRGEMVVRLACNQAPLTCLNFLQLANQGFYDGLTFYRVAPDFVAEAGDPRGDGWGGPGYTIRDEVNPLRIRRGVLAMGVSERDTGGSRFFIALAPLPRLDGSYTAFGEVTGGLEVLDRLVEGDRIEGFRELP